MHNHSPINGHDPRFARNHDEKQRMNDGGWGADPRTRNTIPMYNLSWRQEDKDGFKAFTSRAARSMASIKSYVLRQFSHTRTSRVSLTSAKPSNSNMKFLVLCGIWYSTSALSSNTGKAILTQFRYPVTLTFIQFGFVAFYCLLLMSPIIRFSRLRAPTWAIVRSTLPMGMFQVGGHMFSSIAISRIPVSTVHTIKVDFTLSICCLMLISGPRHCPHCSPWPHMPFCSA